MTKWMRKTVPAAGAGVLAAGLLLLEPAARAGQSAAADNWQLYLGSEYHYCEGCCWGLCCPSKDPCRYPIEPT